MKKSGAVIEKVDKDGNIIGDGSYHVQERVYEFNEYPQIYVNIDKALTTETTYVKYTNRENGKSITVRFSNHVNNAVIFGDQLDGNNAKRDEILFHLGLKKRTFIPNTYLNIWTQQVAKKKLNDYEYADKTIKDLYALGESADISEYKGKIAKGSNYLILGDSVEKLIDKTKNSLGQTLERGEYVYSDISTPNIKFDEGGEVNKETKMDKLSGGKSDKKDIYQIAREQNVGMDFAIEQWNKGTEVEMEHTNDKSVAKEISLDHLSESVNYYIELEKMEQKLKEKGLIDGEPEKETINALGEQFNVSRSWVDATGNYTDDESKRAKILIRVAHKADVMVLTYPSFAYPEKVTNQEAVDIFIKDKNVKEQIILHPRSAQELRRSLELAKEQELPKEKVYDIQKSYFSEYVSEDPSLLSEFLESIKHLTKDRRFDFGSEITWSQEHVGGQDHIKRFLNNVEKQNLNLYDLLPESFRKQVKVKRIDFTPSPESEGLVKITDLFVSFDELRPQLMGTYFDKENDLIACTNTHILLLISAIPDVEKSSICLMGKALNYYKTKVLANPNEIDQNNDGCWEYSANKYPDYMRVISREYPNVIDINVDNLSTYLKTVGEYLANYITRQVYIGYTEASGDKVFIGVNAFLLLDCLKGLQMLGHKDLDLCHDGMPNRAITIIPSGNSRKIGKKSIKTDLALCMPVMVREPQDYEVMYDLDENTVKTVAKFYGRETKEEIVPDPVIDNTELEEEDVQIEVSDPVEPVEEVSIPEPIAEPVIEKSDETQEIKDEIEGLQLLKGLTKSRKEKKNIQDTIDGLNILLEMPETFGLGGNVNTGKFYALWSNGMRQKKYQEILSVSYWKDRKVDHNPALQNIIEFLGQIPHDETIAIYTNNDAPSFGNLHSAYTPLYTNGAESVDAIVDSGNNIIWNKYEGSKYVLNINDYKFQMGGQVNIDETTFKNSPAYIETVDNLTQIGLYDPSLSDSEVYAYYMELGYPKFKDAPEYFEHGGELNSDAKDLIGKEVYVKFRNDVAIIDGINGNFVKLYYPEAGFFEALNYNVNEIIVLDKAITLAISEKNPLSNQLSKITGGPYNTQDYVNLSGEGLNSKFFKHIKTGQIFRTINKADYDEYIRLYDKYGEIYGDEKNPHERELLKMKLDWLESRIHKYERPEDITQFVDGNTTYRISKIPNENRYGIYVTSDDFLDSFGGRTALVNSHSKTIEEAQKKIKEMIEKKMYALGGIVTKNEIISELPQ